jgi:hypothetical protein
MRCVTKVEETCMWQWRGEHNYLEKEKILSSIVICYNVLHYSQKVAPALVLECYDKFSTLKYIETRYKIINPLKYIKNYDK